MAPPGGTDFNKKNDFSELLIKNMAADPNITSLFYNGHATETEVDTEQSGKFPSWISGLMCRNGPGKFDIGSETYGHWFDPLALLHRFKIENGHVTYQSKFLESDVYKKNMAQGRIVYAGFGSKVKVFNTQNHNTLKEYYDSQYIVTYC